MEDCTTRCTGYENIKKMGVVPVVSILIWSGVFKGGLEIVKPASIFSLEKHVQALSTRLNI
jgi:hypothetical protein